MDGNRTITKTTHQDNAYWEYEHDGRMRLTKAERDDSGDTLLTRYAYTYDDGDNMITKEVYTPGSGTVTTAFSHNDANELTSMTTGGTTTNFTYDDWGRTVSKYISGSYSAAFAYRYDSMLYSVTSDFPGESNVTYEYDGGGRRRERTAGGTTTKYKWSQLNVINEEDSNGTLSMTYTLSHPYAGIAPIVADVAGADPDTGSYRYYFHNYVGSTGRLRAQDKSSLASYELTPYGNVYAFAGPGSTTRLFAGHDWDSGAQLYYARHRYYSPSLARFLTRDPRGMRDGPNLYAYTRDNPINLTDPTGGQIAPNLIKDLPGWVTQAFKAKDVAAAANDDDGAAAVKCCVDKAGINDSQTSREEACQEACECFAKLGLDPLGGIDTCVTTCVAGLQRRDKIPKSMTDEALRRLQDKPLLEGEDIIPVGKDEDACPWLTTKKDPWHWGDGPPPWTNDLILGLAAILAYLLAQALTRRRRRTSR